MTRSLKRIFAPRNIAVIGASNRENSIGRTVMQNLIDGAFPGGIFPFNPKHDRILGQPAYPSIRESPERIDLAIVCTPSCTVPEIVDQCGVAGVAGMVILTAGFREIGKPGEALQRQLQAAIDRHPAMRVIGPNCLGVIAPHTSLNASFSAGMPHPGHVAFLSQSGALCTAVLDWALDESIGFSGFVSTGNSIDVGMGDLIEHFANDPETDALVLYIESIEDARRFMSAARGFTRSKPIIAYKAGRFEDSARAAASHTGAMAGVDAVYDAAFRRAGIVRIHDMRDMFDAAELLCRDKRPQGSRLALVTNAGGPGVMATDELLAQRGILAQLSKSTLHELDQCLPSNWSRANPVDVIGDATPERFAEALKIVIADEQVDTVIAMFAPQAMSDPAETARRVIEIQSGTPKPILTAWLGGRSMRAANEAFNQAGIPTYESPEQAVRAFLYLDDYHRMQRLLASTPKEEPATMPCSRERIDAILGHAPSDGAHTLSETASKELLLAAGIPVCASHVVSTREQAVAVAHEIGYPVAMKIHSPDISHKTEVGGVRLNLDSDEAIHTAFDEIVRQAKHLRPKARIAGVSIQRMVIDPSGRELILGAKHDPVFGMVLMAGAGGTMAELLQDRVLELPPLTPAIARQMLESLRMYPLLTGFRGAPPVALDKVVEVLMQLSSLIVHCPEILELDINPLLATPNEVIALDARVIIARGRKSTSITVLE